jgi:predicted DNA binding CopG/RHH family protein
MKPVQLFSDDYLEQCKDASPEAILEFLESFRLMNKRPEKSKLISMKIPVSLLEGFRRRCELEGVKYQTQIKKLMERWLRGG